MQATYSPEDNKLRLYAGGRLDPETYSKVHGAGFRWAPKQELFVAPMWTPSREDLLLELCEEIGDEDTSLVERAEDRAGRFETYSENRARDAKHARAAVSTIADNIPLGQPILVGHHSEKRARRDAEKIENGMRRAIKMWDQSEYWTDRAAGALRHAKYKELPAVRARRIKKLEAELRGHERSKAKAENMLKLWAAIDSQEKALRLAGCHPDAGWLTCHKLSDGRRFNAHDVLQPDGERYKDCPAMTFEQVKEIAARGYPKTIAYCDRWLAHYSNRLAYERAMLAESGGLAADKFNFKVGGQVKRRGQWFVILKINLRNGAFQSLTVAGHWKTTIGPDEIQDYKDPAPGDWEKARAVSLTPPLCNYPGEGFLHQTEAEYKNTVPKWSDFPKTRTIEATAGAVRHRVRNQRKPGGNAWAGIGVFLTDKKETRPPRPEGTAPELPARELPDMRGPRPAAAPDAGQVETEAIRASLRQGIKVVSAPQLFPTPADLAIALAAKAFDYPRGWGVQIGVGMNERCRVLEPSAGTGNLLKAIEDLSKKDARSTLFDLVAVEVNLTLAHDLAARYPAFDIRRGDFLSFNGELGKFDRILMNPPFKDGADIKHIMHARGMLADGGRLVAFCANGPRQREALIPIADEWIDLGAGAFLEAGTNVNTALLVIDK